MQPQQNSLWSKDFTLFWLTNFLMAVGFYFLLPTIPFYAVKVLGADESQVGYIIGIYTLSALAIRPLAGYALDSMGRRKIYLWAMAVFGLLIGTYYFATSLIILLVLRLIHGFSWGVTTTGGGTIVADILPPQRRGEGVGYFGLSMNLAMAIGPGIGLWLMNDNRYAMLFFGSMIMVAMAFLLANLITYPKVPLTKKSLSWEAFFEKKVAPASIVMFFTTLVYGGVITFITLYSQAIGIKNGGLFFLSYSIALALVRPLAGKLLDRRGPGLVVTLGFISMITGFVLLSASQGLYSFMAAAIFMGFGYGAVWPTLQTMVINMVEPHRRGVANSTLFSALDLGIAGGSVLLGWLANFTSMKTMYLISAIIIIIPMLYFFLYVAKDYKAKMLLLKDEHHD
ncbi:MAG: MFS transporter [Clostridia bacterium]|nr:MFS transporter [Clostridia bacterium]